MMTDLGIALVVLLYVGYRLLTSAVRGLWR